MDSKKTPRADLDRERTIYFLLGFIVALASFFVLMEWQTPPPDEMEWQGIVPDLIESEYIGEIEKREIPEEIPEPEEVEEIPAAIEDDYVVVEEVTPAMELVADSIQSTPPEEGEATPDPEVVDPEAQEEEAPADPVPDTRPQFPGGNPALARYLYEHIQYPSAALKQRIQGRVWCSFVVNTDGSVSGVRLEQGVYIFLDDEALRVLKRMPPWNPGKAGGKAVRMRVYLPVVFKL